MKWISFNGNSSILLMSKGIFSGQTFLYCKTLFPSIQVFTHKDNFCLKDLYLLRVTRKIMEQILVHLCSLNDCFKVYVSINN